MFLMKIDIQVINDPISQIFMYYMLVNDNFPVLIYRFCEKSICEYLLLYLPLVPDLFPMLNESISLV